MNELSGSWADFTGGFAGSPAGLTLALIAGLILLAGGSIALKEHLSQEIDSGLRARFVSWLWMIPLALVPVGVGGWLWVLAVGLLILAAQREFFKLARPDWNVWPVSLTACGLSLTTASLWPDAFTLLPLVLIVLPLIERLLNQESDNALRDASVTGLGLVLIGWTLAHLIPLRAEGWEGVLVLLLAVVLNDVLAYTGGRLLGQYPLAPRISPNKTWEGFLCGIAASVTVFAALGYLLPQILWQRLLFGLLVGLAAPLGDLSLSLLKRDLAVKDTGSVIPGHGGLLDRLDSLILSAPLFFYLLCWMAG
ncbi:phosphatidate cytidylyltransferase [Leptolyngbya sp. FACHB-261]|uniref:phosphatidate cytidylyltransferase n=1 Tax=Leptolyngbya sp. FACHB-261 TaxID=2692806 RepID=UPI0016829D99|nr:phosphatidate cytidylyltransferase [Leptolyngbya sp. FACHB-261]MBD2103435.1 phosphatidate cytidylyltransferase [Leptolyngbya sp. FACHB-261]